MAVMIETASDKFFHLFHFVLHNIRKRSSPAAPFSFAAHKTALRRHAAGLEIVKKLQAAQESERVAGEHEGAKAPMSVR